jgi:hypothetical protein
LEAIEAFLVYVRGYLEELSDEVGELVCVGVGVAWHDDTRPLCVYVCVCVCVCETVVVWGLVLWGWVEHGHVIVATVLLIFHLAHLILPTSNSRHITRMMIAPHLSLTTRTHTGVRDERVGAGGRQAREGQELR